MWDCKLIPLLFILCIILHLITDVEFSDTAFLVDLPDCKIPDSPLFPEEILAAWNASFATSCPKNPKIGSLSKDKILTLDASVESDFRECCYREIQRPEQLESDRFTLSDCLPITVSDSVDMSSMDYLLINCTEESPKKSPRGYVLDFHYNIHKQNPEVQSKLKYWENFEGDKPLSIMIVIIDSVSRNHALRSMPKTMSYIRDDLNFVDYKGYHCVDEPSSVNYIPMTLGILWSDLENIRSMLGKYDNEPFVYKNFSRSQYLTMQMEDMAEYNVFNWNGRTGFTQKPYDFYLRPYILSHEKLAPKKTCMNGKKIWDFMLDYTVEFVDMFPKIPKYITTYVTWPNHDYMGGTRVLDDSLRGYFQKLEESGALNSTVVFVVADHSFRYVKEFAESKYGLLERNLPMFLVKVPPRFIPKYPKAYENLVRNAERLTSHLDLFKTITHLHQLMATTEKFGHSYGHNMKYGRSLFEKIPKNRTCEDAKIKDRFCSCNFPLFSSDFDYEKYKKPLTG